MPSGSDSDDTFFHIFSFAEKYSTGLTPAVENYISEPQAMNIVVQHYAGYIAHLSMRKLRDERGNTGIVSAILFTIIGSSVMNVETPITA